MAGDFYKSPHRGEICITPYKPKAQCGDYQKPLMRPDRDATH